MIDLTALMGRVSDLALRISGKPDLRWAVVVTAVPLTIQFDADAAPLLGSPSSLVDGLRTGDRVQVAIQNRRATVLGSQYSKPPGAILQSASPKHPGAQWILADGAFLNPADEPRLFDEIGTHYGGNGVTTFKLPDYRGRVLVGVSPTDPEFTPLGKVFGAKTHSLTQNELASHLHAQNVSANAGSVPGRRDYAGEGPFQAPYSQGVNTNATGGNAAHNNVQPSAAVFIYIHR